MNLALHALVLLALPSFAFGSAPKGIWTKIDSTYYSPYAFTVDKTQRKLAVWKIDTTPFKKIKEYHNDQGKVAGNKTTLGDNKTPEGIYFFLEQKNGHDINYDRYGERIFTLDYPNFFDKHEGKTGYGIWLHGIPDTTPLDRGSEGCVVLRNENVIDVTENIHLGKTPILIFNEVETISEKERQKEEDRMLGFLNDWQNAWQNKNIDSYMSHYSDDFKATGMNKEQWAKHKSSLNKKYENIEVRLSKPVIYESEGKIVVRSLQHYRSDHHEDYGEKFIYLVRENESFKILHEKWQPISKEIVMNEIGVNNISRNDGSEKLLN